MDRNENKYQIEKVLHEIIRDMPEARRTADNFKHGYITFEEALEEIAYVVRKEKES